MFDEVVEETITHRWHYPGRQTCCWWPQEKQFSHALDFPPILGSYPLPLNLFTHLSGIHDPTAPKNGKTGFALVALSKYLPIYMAALSTLFDEQDPSNPYSLYNYNCTTHIINIAFFSRAAHACIIYQLSPDVPA